MIRKTELLATDLDQLLLNINLQCVYMHIAQKKDKWECSSHVHDYLETGYIYKGSGQYHIDGIDYYAEAGDLVPHYEIHDSDNPFQIVFLMIKFNGKERDLLNDNILSLQGKVHVRDERKVREIFDDIIDEVIIQNSGYLSSIDAKLKSLLILMYRQVYFLANETAKITIKLSSLDRNKRVIEEIQKFLLEDIHGKSTVDSISQQFFYNPKYLSSIFKKETGSSLSNLIQSIRIEKSREMLLLNDYSIEMIAERLGFSSVNHFYKSFKKVTGKAPTSYRSEYLGAPSDPFMDASMH